MTLKKYREMTIRVEQSLDYSVAGAEMEFTEELARVMEQKNISRAELARRIETSQAYITKILRGNVNFTLATMVKLARAMDMDVRMHLAPRHSRTVWKDDVSNTFDKKWNDRPGVRAEIGFGQPFEEENDGITTASA